MVCPGRYEPSLKIEAAAPARRVVGHLQRAGHAALDGAGAVPAGDIESLASGIIEGFRFTEGPRHYAVVGLHSRIHCDISNEEAKRQAPLGVNHDKPS